MQLTAGFPHKHRSFRDPRFDSLAGTFEEGKFRKQYGFIYDEQLPQEQVELQHSLKVSSSSPAGLLLCHVVSLPKWRVSKNSWSPFVVLPSSFAWLAALVSTIPVTGPGKNATLSFIRSLNLLFKSEYTIL